MEEPRLKSLDYSVLQQCMHCGMCLPTCPTYQTTKAERHSPRGRIALMRAVADDQLPLDDQFADEMDYCLGCLACTTACPAGVDYPTMFEFARADSEKIRTKPTRRFLRWLTLNQLFLHPKRLHLLGSIIRLYQNSFLKKIPLPSRLAALANQAPEISPITSDRCIAQIETPPAGTPTRGRVGLLSGCVQSIAFSDVNRATVDALLHNGWEVVTPHNQSCCGSIHAHNGAPEWAAQSATALIDQFDLPSLDALITNAGGCGAHLKRYHHLLPDHPLSQQWDEKVKDIHEFLVETGFQKPTSSSPPQTITYHESCHLRHGQNIANAPREILRSIPNLTLTELPESSQCCGSAGIYNLLQPEESAIQLDRKLHHIASTNSPTVATSNPGCHLQIQNGLRDSNSPTTVTQPIILLAQAYKS